MYRIEIRARLSEKAKAAGVALPSRQTDDSAGLDLRALEGGIIYSGEQALIETGLHLAIPRGVVGIIKSRSGLSVKVGLEHGAGVIDPDYRGEVKIVLRYLKTKEGSDLPRPFRWEQGERLAQILFIPYFIADLIEVNALPDTERGEGGFGSTGSD